ncbi:hypothetical protein P4H42_05690 [Paenibacillus macerans]|uniref:hypothetical protein n=1 Tax=Paenibacillus macerans TaxID=44252 RepID=UPI002DBB0967|nr:hypothetical protein [Paenibacillus macerans]MEC0329115.1 hypothetical protein [Paenibacillus macerans]MED4954250.1 hypothetical protein [Paenibacillus macerans]
MKDVEYKELLEKKYGKTLKEIMHELIVDRYMDQWEGAKELGIPTELFVKWRTRFRLGPMQRTADLAKKRRLETIEKYEAEIQSIDLYRDFTYKDENSLRGFKEIIERMLELSKQKRVRLQVDSFSDMSMMIQIGTFESIISYLEQYEKNELHKKFELELQFLNLDRDFG